MQQIELGTAIHLAFDELQPIDLPLRMPNWAVALLLAQSGCRANEVAGLRISHLDLEGYNAVVDGKGDKRRVIVFGPESAEAIRARLAIRPVDADHDCVFTSTHGHGPLTARAVSQIIRRLCRVAGIRSVGAHSFRYFVGMSLAREQIAPPIIKEYLGHSSISTTMGYCSAVEEQDLHDVCTRLLSLVRSENKKPVGKCVPFSRAIGETNWGLK